jgi:Putative GTPases (G3E family)
MDNINKNKTQVDLITGFLGVGKTTYIAKYIDYLKSVGQTFAVIENEFGMAGVDSKILSMDNAVIKELSGGCICCSLKVNFHDMLVELSGHYDRIIVEPSGIFNPYDFFTIMKSLEVLKSCQMGCMITIVDPIMMNSDLTEDEIVIINSELENTGCVVVSKVDSLSDVIIDIPDKCIYPTPLTQLSNADFKILQNKLPDNKKIGNTIIHERIYQSCTVYPSKLYTINDINEIFTDISDHSNILRVKGYVKSTVDDKCWLINYSLGGNSAVEVLCDETITQIVNVIGNNLDRKWLKGVLK